ncbi:MAG: DivIVA domain-containing protein [bacterium]|nr:DivIVA domain-containing protein [bacterium]
MLTPQDILTQKFSVKSKGFDKEEVTAFLGQVAEILEHEILEKERLKMDVEKLKGSLSKMEKKEDILRDTLIAAQKFSREIKNNAAKESQLAIKEAEIKSERIITDAVNRQRELREQIRSLRLKRQEIENNIAAMLDTIKEMMETYRRDDEDLDKIEYLAK